MNYGVLRYLVLTGTIMNLNKLCRATTVCHCRPPFPQCNLRNTFLLLPRKCNQPELSARLSFVDLTLVAPPLLPSMAVYRKLSGTIEFHCTGQVDDSEKTDGPMLHHQSFAYKEVVTTLEMIFWML
ncbi:hypothetical protein Bca52824_053681 [Brassica carinata]|uniref:Uncharacterized protein n=1 Tax=Brassica carinata TaxID=52824 RepID=A0A8X7R638_BRACI|nr:hypothetical protein Bca52824_053681 [Brassica carinata]